ncbi:MAG: putative lipid II flippase FtsW [Deltaproteobacteria bacterium]|jgi:cell division protein FtsW|nr:putative lipid II flippase FtsW [Deltaproteobacteria bacterium]
MGIFRKEASDRANGGIDTMLLSIFFLLLGIGLANLLSASSAIAQLYKQDPYYYLKAQSIRALAGLGLIVAIFFVPRERLRQLAPWGLIATLIILLLPFVPSLRDPQTETYRWIRVMGISVQPSELARVGVVLFMAWSLSRCGNLAKDFWYGFAQHMVILVIFGLLIVLEMDLGGAVIVCGIIIMMCFLSGLRYIYFLLFFLLLGLGFYYYVSDYGYRIDRISGWLDPFADPQGKGYVIIHSFYAFANGGVFGVGPGQSIEKLFFIPEIHTDYVFAVVGEELGLIGVTLVSGLYLAFAVRGMMIAKAATNLFDYYLACGATLIIALPAFVNMFVALSILPAKGLALPFFSYGGSNMLVSCMAVGFLLNVARRGARKGAGGKEPAQRQPLMAAAG